MSQNQHTPGLRERMTAKFNTAAEITPLDEAWERINALGGYVAPGDMEGSGFQYAIDKALEVIEELGGRDPAPLRKQLNQA